MALIRCEDCEAEVSDRAPACPKCGGPIGGTRTESGRVLVASAPAPAQAAPTSTVAITCAHCGAPVEASEDMVHTTCSYCGSSLRIEHDTTGAAFTQLESDIQEVKEHAARAAAAGDRAATTNERVADELKLARLKKDLSALRFAIGFGSHKRKRELQELLKRMGAAVAAREKARRDLLAKRAESTGKAGLFAACAGLLLVGAALLAWPALVQQNEVADVTLKLGLFVFVLPVALGWLHSRHVLSQTKQRITRLDSGPPAIPAELSEQFQGKTTQLNQTLAKARRLEFEIAELEARLAGLPAPDSHLADEVPEAFDSAQHGAITGPTPRPAPSGGCAAICTPVALLFLYASYVGGEGHGVAIFSAALLLIPLAQYLLARFTSRPDELKERFGPPFERAGLRLAGAMVFLILLFAGIGWARRSWNEHQRVSRGRELVAEARAAIEQKDWVRAQNAAQEAIATESGVDVGTTLARAKAEIAFAAAKECLSRKEWRTALDTLTPFAEDAREFHSDVDDVLNTAKAGHRAALLELAKIKVAKAPQEALDLLDQAARLGAEDDLQSLVTTAATKACELAIEAGNLDDADKLLRRIPDDQSDPLRVRIQKARLQQSLEKAQKLLDQGWAADAIKVLDPVKDAPAALELIERAREKIAEDERVAAAKREAEAKAAAEREEQEREEAKRRAQEAEETRLRAEGGERAIRAAKTLVYESLRSPSTAQWVSARVIDSKHPKYLVHVVVDAQNAFGATIRDGFLAVVTIKSGDEFAYNQAFGLQKSGRGDPTQMEVDAMKQLNNWDKQ